MWKFTSFFLYYLVAIFTLGQTSLAIDAFNCSDVEVDGIKFDLSNLKLQNITKEEQTPPTITITSSLINLCEPLPIDKKNETCPDGTYVCQIITNKLSKEDKSPRVITIRPIAGDLNDEGIFKPVIALEPASNKDDTSGPLLITLNGGSYAEQKQQANFTFICNTEKDNITTVEYNNEENTLIIRWETPAACGQKILEDKGMSWFTKFIIFLIIIALCYFGFGAAYNYHVYKAHGWDLLPHLDFWRDFPYLISDVFKYLINSIRTGQAGYNRV